MQQQPVAPWGEVIATDRPMTVEDLLNLPDDGHMYELVEGHLVRMLPSGGGASSLALRLGARIEAFVEQHSLGAVTGADGEFDLGHGTALAPDVAFVRAERAPPPTSPIYVKAWPLSAGRWADASRRSANHDPPEGPGPSLRDDPPRWDPH